MKKLISIVAVFALALSLALSVASCKKEEVTTTTTVEEVITTTDVTSDATADVQ